MPRGCSNFTFRSQIAVILGDLVLEHQVVAEGVPGELGDEAMILVGVVTAGTMRRSGATDPSGPRTPSSPRLPARGRTRPGTLEYQGGLLEVLQERCGAADRLPFRTPAAARTTQVTCSHKSPAAR
jgi:hypothetical protein